MLSGGPEFIARLLAHYAWINEAYRRGAASHVIRLRDVFIHYHTILHVAADGEVLTLYETARAIDRPYNPQPDWTAAELRRQAIRMGGDRPSLYLGSAGAANYGHWLVDDLARAEAVGIIAEAAGSGVVDLVIPGFGATLDGVKQQSLRAMQAGGAEHAACFVPHGSVLHFDELHYVTPITFHPTLKSPQARRLLRDRASAYPFVFPALRSAKRLFVLRNKAYGRTVANPDEVVRVFSRHGFVAMDVDGLTFGQQVALFKDAEIVAGCMGAAMTTALFCADGTTVLHLAPEGWMEPFYWDLAAVCGHRYAALYGTPIDPAVEPHRSSFTIDPARLQDMLARLLA